MFKKFLMLIVAVIFCSFTYNTEAIVVDKRPITVGVSYLQDNEITKAMLNGAKKAAKKLNAQLFVRNGRGETDVQMAQIHDLIAQQTNCLVVIIEDPKANSRLAENGEQSNIPIVLVESKITDKQAAFNAAYNAVEEAWNKAKYNKKVQPAFYSGY